MASNQTLPAKEQAVFRSILKFYETKQYKKGIKAADSVLKKFPEHGETMCMKGLTLSYLDKKEEAYALVRKGLKFDLRSHVCWHVYGLLYRQDCDYFEAVKCYKTALKIDNDNMQILRDLSLLQIHRRDLNGFVDTRRKILQVKPSNPLNWIAYAISEHLRGSYELAWTIVENYENTFKDESVTDYENSELHMYKASVMEEAGKLQDALDCLVSHEDKIVDKIGLLETKAKLLMFLGRLEESGEIYRKLISLNPEHQQHILGLLASQKQFQRFWPAIPAPQEGNEVPKTVVSFPQTVHPEGTPIYGWLQPASNSEPRKRMTVGKNRVKCQVDSRTPLEPLTGDEEGEICKFFDGLQADHPKSDSLASLILYFLNGDRFVYRLDRYLRPRIRKGIPSIFRTMRPLYGHAGKPVLVEKLLLQYIENLTKDESHFSATHTDEAEEPPSSLLFAYKMIAEHFDFMGDTAKALEYADMAMEHTPTLVEIYSTKARIYKHAGDNERSAQLFDEVRSMDLADRFLNCQAVKAMLQIDDVQVGMDKALLFSREPELATGTGPLRAGNLHDMQCMWYESAVARSFVRQGEYGKALKVYGETFRHFNDINEDQFDFHNYCLRKYTLRTYVGMLRMQQRLYSHKFYRRAAKDAIKVHLKLADMKERGELVAGGKDDGEDANVSAADKKKNKNAAKRAKKAEEAKQVAAAPAKAGKAPKKVDEDPDGKKLLEKEHMEEASKLLKTLVLNCGNDAATHKLQYEVSSRQKKLLHCLQALVQLWRLCGEDPTHHKLVEHLAHFCFAMDLENDATPAVVKEVVMHELAPVLGAPAALDGVSGLRTKASAVVDSVVGRLETSSVIDVLAGIKCMKYAGKDVKAFLAKWKPESPFRLKDCKKLLAYLGEEFGKDSAERTRFKDRCLEVFPLLVVE